MSKSDKEIIVNIKKEYPEDIEAQIRLTRFSFNVPRGEALAILENFAEA